MLNTASHSLSDCNFSETFKVAVLLSPEGDVVSSFKDSHDISRVYIFPLDSFFCTKCFSL
jgi:hypothetical protein